MEPHVTRWLESKPARPAQDFTRLTANELNHLADGYHPGFPISGDATTAEREGLTR